MTGGRCEALRDALSRRGLGWEIARIALAGETARETARTLADALSRGTGRVPEPSDGLCPASIDDPWGIAVMTGMQRQHQTVEVDGASERWAAHKAWFLTLIAPSALCAIVTEQDAQTRRAREAIACEGRRIGHHARSHPHIRIGEPEALVRALRGRDVSALIDITSTPRARSILQTIGGALTRWIDVREKREKRKKLEKQPSGDRIDRAEGADPNHGR